ncbi:MAG: ParA family protein [Actinobacteria bacterium]|nr:ParA family protein [Actinomycetota bacterium]
MTRVIAVANQKGGVGKTTTAVNMAASLASPSCRVLVIDLDPQGNASTALGYDRESESAGMYEVMIGEAELIDVILPCPDIPGLDCAPADVDLAGAEIEMVAQDRREFALRVALEDLERNYDYVFIDCPPSLGLLTLNALVGAREVLLPIQCEYYALEGLSQLLKTVDMVKSHLNPNLTVGAIILTMYDGRTRLAGQVAEEVRTHFGARVLDTIIPRSVRLSEAPSHGQTIFTYDPSSPGAVAYREAAEQFALVGN